MILKVFKEKSNLNYINKLMNARKATVDNRKLNSIGVILNLNEYNDFEAFRTYLKSLGFKSNKIKIITFTENEKESGFQWETYFNPKDFGWKGKIKSIELQEFIETEFDALISFYKLNLMELNIITAQSKANFKIGLSNSDQRLFDLIIDVKPNDFEVFKNELKKYLIVLNKI